MTNSVVIALGSNLGDRRWYLARALDAMRREVSVVRVSSIYETVAVDSPHGSPPYLNMVVLGHTALAPLALLDALQRIERNLGRRRGVRNAPRTIDLDLIVYSGVRMRTGRLTLPHPRYAERAFVLEPLREVWRGGRLPVARATAPAALSSRP